ncbi:uncharacterized protein A4U43_C10F9320 [Asparagus officinalis]|uniref:pyridoxal 5'-phosphate synthase n=1 Tax=Asparagus officinalis TaxID=4686 RepID=A0A5P1E3E9_ASPOF|nr:uncharacterized protein A4U43_C10F9320 [Asparagus officinalis]
MASSGSWKPLLLAALESNAHLKNSTYFQLATMASNGRPSNRTVVFRGFQEGTDKIQINTDTRTNKIEEIRHCPFGEICWYFADSWEQFRIGGRIEIIDGSSTDPAKLMNILTLLWWTSIRCIDGGARICCDIAESMGVSFGIVVG